MKLAILIAVYNEPEHILKQCRKTFLKENAKVYIAVNKYDTKTLKLARKIFKEFEVIVSPSKSHLKASNINYAVDFIKEPITAIFDVDNIPSKDYCKECVYELETNNIGMVVGQECGYNENENLLTKIESLQQLDYFRLTKNLYKIINPTNSHIPILGAGFFVYTKDLQKIKMSEETVTEDDDFSVRLVRNKINSKIIDDKFYILHPTKLRESINQRTRWLTGRFQLFKLNPDLKEVSNGLDMVYKRDFGMVFVALFKLLFAIFIGITCCWWIGVLFYLFTLEMQHLEYFRTHSLISRKTTYSATLFEIVYIWILIRAYWNYKFRPKHWYLTKK